jgi:hypothetical protein
MGPTPARTWHGRGFYRVHGVTADAGGRPDEKDVRMVIFIQNRPL